MHGIFVARGEVEKPQPTRYEVWTVVSESGEWAEVRVSQRGGRVMRVLRCKFGEGVKFISGCNEELIGMPVDSRGRVVLLNDEDWNIDVPQLGEVGYPVGDAQQRKGAKE